MNKLNETKIEVEGEIINNHSIPDYWRVKQQELLQNVTTIKDNFTKINEILDSIEKPRNSIHQNFKRMNSLNQNQNDINQTKVSREIDSIDNLSQIDEKEDLISKNYSNKQSQNVNIINDEDNRLHNIYENAESENSYIGESNLHKISIKEKPNDDDPFTSQSQKDAFDPNFSQMNVEIINKVSKNSTSITTLHSKLKLSNKQMKELVYEINDYPNSCIVIESNFLVVMINKNFMLETGYHKSELVSQTLVELIIDEYKENFQYQLQNCVKLNSNSNSLIMEIKNKDGTLQMYNQKIEKMEINNEIDLYIIQLDRIKTNDTKQTIDPRNIFYLIYSLIMFIIIILLLFWIPQDLSFGDEWSFKINSMFDGQLTALFVFDMMINFFIAQEIEDDVFEFRLDLVWINYLQTFFIIDLISTIPQDTFIKSDDLIDANILKTIRASKFIRLIKLLRLSKLFSVFSTKNIKNNPVGQYFMDFYKSNSGLIELFIQNSYILIFAHFYSCLFYWLKNNLIIVDGQDWLFDQYGISQDQDPQSIHQNPVTLEQVNLDIQMIIVTENVKTALGLGVIRPQTRAEIMLNLTWMFIGLSLFGYGIGNISSFINMNNKLELHKSETQSYFNELCEDNDVNPEMYKMLMDDINQQYKHFNETQFQEMARVLSKPVLMKLESTLMSEFVSSFPLLESLSLNGVRIIKNLCRFRNREVDIGKGSKVDKALFITKGMLKVYNDEMFLVNEQKSHEIFGMSQFKKYFISKYAIDIDLQFGQVKKKRVSDKVSLKESLESMQGDQKFQILRQKNDDIPLKANNILKVYQEEEIFEIKQNNHLSASADIEYFEISQKNLEAILLNDSATFQHIWQQNQMSYEKISKSERKESQMTFRQFNNHSLPGMIILEDGSVQDANTALMEADSRFRELIGTNVSDHFWYDSFTGKKKVQSMIDITQGDQTVEFDSYWHKALIRINNKQFKLLTRSEDIFDQSMKVDTQYFSLKKSMLKTFIVYFDIISDSSKATDKYE